MRQKIIQRGGGLLVLFVLLMLTFCSCAVKEKELISSEGLLARYSFDQAMDNAEYVVYGTVVEKGKPVELIEGVSRSGTKYANCYRVVTVEVIECAKGDLRAGDTVTYWEWGGETRDRIYRYSYTQEVEKGDTVLVFVNDGHYIGPDWLWILDPEKDETIRMENWKLPESMASKATTESYAATVPLRSLLDAVRAQAEGTVGAFVGKTVDEPTDENTGEAE